GSKKEWMVEGGTPNTLLRRGITRDSLTAGTELVIDGYQARDHSLLRANGRNVTYPDGRKLFLGSSGTGAPTDGSDPPATPQDRSAHKRRDHSLRRANGRNVTYPDGRKLFLGSSGTGAPTDGSDPTEAPKGRGRGGRERKFGFRVSDFWDSGL